MIKLFFLTTFISVSIVLFAQPSDAVIRKDLTNETTIDIKFTKSTGTRQWNSSLGNWEYVRGVHIRRRTAEYPGLVVKVVGDAVYQSMGGSKYSYLKFRVISNDWEGVPKPTEAEIIKFIEADWKKFYGYSYNKIIKLISGPSLNKEKDFTWSKPTNALFYMTIKAEILGDKYAVETVEQDYEIRFYRDDIKGPWTSFLGGSVKNKKVLSSRTASALEYKKLEKQTLAYTVAEEAVRKELESVPDFTVPDFASAKEIADFFHEILLNGNPGLLKLAILKTSSRFLLEEGSETQLTLLGQQSYDEAVKNAYQGTYKYKDQYCKNYSTGKDSWDKKVYIKSAFDKTETEIGSALFPGGYKEGVLQMKRQLTSIVVRVREDQDYINFISSFSDKSKLCPND